MSNSEHSLQQRKSISYDASERPQQSEQTFASVRSLGAIACEADCLYCRVGEMHPSITDNTEQKERREMAEQTLTLDAKQDGITTKIENAKVSSEFSIPEDLYAGEKLPTITNGNQGNLNGNKPIVVKIPFDISDGLDGKKAPNRKSAVVLASRIEYAASTADEGAIDLDAVSSAEPEVEDQSAAVESEDAELDFVSEAEIAELEASFSDSNAVLDDDFLSPDEHDDMTVQDLPSALDDDELDFVSEAEIAELEASLSDSDAALDDEFLSLGEHDDMAVQDSPSALDDTTDLQDDFLDADDAMAGIKQNDILGQPLRDSWLASAEHLV